MHKTACVALRVVDSLGPLIGFWKPKAFKISPMRIFLNHLSSLNRLKIAAPMLIAVVFQSIAGTINGSLSGPFVPRTGKWTPLPNGGFEGRIGSITNSTGYTGSGNFILVVPEGTSSSALVASSAAAVGRYGARVRPGNTGGKSIALG